MHLNAFETKFSGLGVFTESLRVHNYTSKMSYYANYSNIGCHCPNSSTMVATLQAIHVYFREWIALPTHWAISTLCLIQGHIYIWFHNYMYMYDSYRHSFQNHEQAAMLSQYMPTHQGKSGFKLGQVWPYKSHMKFDDIGLLIDSLGTCICILTKVSRDALITPA